jgi:hypothetical protein
MSIALERDLYAMSKSTEDFVEIPRWARRLNDAFWFGGLRASRRDIRVLEGLLVGCGVLFFAASFLITAEYTFLFGVGIVCTVLICWLLVT